MRKGTSKSEKRYGFGMVDKLNIKILSPGLIVIDL